MLGGGTMSGKGTRKGKDTTVIVEQESAEHSPALPHCPQELVKALRKQGIRVKLPGPLEERLQNDLMMEGWLGEHPTGKRNKES
jgi:hypothetical protein